MNFLIATFWILLYIFGILGCAKDAINKFFKKGVKPVSSFV